MKCAVHPEIDATGYCRNCGKALCTGCSREVRGMIYCEACLADMVTQPRVPAVVEGGRSPALATMLGFIPGLGAVYNGEFMKAIIHVLIFATLVAVVSGDHPGSIKAFVGIMIGAFVIYMGIDANLSAKARLKGKLPSDPLSEIGKGKTVWPFVLMGIGVLFLLSNFNVLNVDELINRFWPLLLIAAGGFMVWRRSERQS
jgi:TM2 domain-containing membrane protein YozV